MKITWSVVHGTVIAIWVVAALLLAVDTAMLGGEEAQLQRQRGADRKAQLDLLHRRDRLGAVVEREASPALIEAAARRLDLDLVPPLRVPESGGTALARRE